MAAHRIGEMQNDFELLPHLFFITWYPPLTPPASRERARRSSPFAHTPPRPSLPPPPSARTSHPLGCTRTPCTPGLRHTLARTSPAPSPRPSASVRTPPSAPCTRTRRPEQGWASLLLSSVFSFPPSSLHGTHFFSRFESDGSPPFNSVRLLAIRSIASPAVGLRVQSITRQSRSSRVVSSGRSTRR